VLFVIRDLKEDWWRRGPSGAPRQPRVELVDEMYEETAQRLFMLKPSSLMKQASRILSLEGRVDERSVRALEQLERVELGEGDHWSQESLEALVDLLLETADVQAQATLEAALNGGLISRERVYEIDGHDPSRMLRAFTRPVKTATRRLHDAGAPASGFLPTPFRSSGCSPNACTATPIVWQMRTGRRDSVTRHKKLDSACHFTSPFLLFRVSTVAAVAG